MNKNLAKIIKKEDSKETYNGVGIEIDLNDYFNLAKFYYLINSADKESIKSLSEAYKASVNQYK